MCKYGELASLSDYWINFCFGLISVKYERIKFLVIALKSSVEVYAWAPKPYHKFMAFKVTVYFSHLLGFHILSYSCPFYKSGVTDVLSRLWSSFFGKSALNFLHFQLRMREGWLWEALYLECWIATMHKWMFKMTQNHSSLYPCYK